MRDRERRTHTDRWDGSSIPHGSRPTWPCLGTAEIGVDRPGVEARLHDEEARGGPSGRSHVRKVVQSRPLLPAHRHGPQLLEGAWLEDGVVEDLRTSAKGGELAGTEPRISRRLTRTPRRVGWGRSGACPRSDVRSERRPRHLQPRPGSHRLRTNRARRRCRRAPRQSRSAAPRAPGRGGFSLDPVGRRCWNGDNDGSSVAVLRETLRGEQNERAAPRTSRNHPLPAREANTSPDMLKVSASHLRAQRAPRRSCGASASQREARGR